MKRKNNQIKKMITKINSLVLKKVSLNEKDNKKNIKMYDKLDINLKEVFLVFRLTHFDIF